MIIVQFSVERSLRDGSSDRSTVGFSLRFPFAEDVFAHAMRFAEVLFATVQR